MKTKLLLFLLLLSLTVTAQTNLVPNGNFETWSSSSQPDNWIRFFSGYVSQSTTAQNGKSSVNMMVATGTFNYINSEYFAVQANKTYRVTLYHRAVKGTFSSIDLSLYHKPSTFKEEIIKKSDVTFSTTEWRKIEFEYTSKVAENIEVDIWTNGSLNSEILIDNVSVVDVADVPVQYTLIPDVEFEKSLIDQGLDSGAIDGKVPTLNIKSVKTLQLNPLVISNLTGIQDFESLESLICKGTGISGANGGNGKLTNLDVSKNLNLKTLDVSSNQLTSLDVSKNTALTSLNFSANKIPMIDLTNNVKLTSLTFNYNQIKDIDVTKNIALENLEFTTTLISAIDLSQNTALTNLRCVDNPGITLIDVSQNIGLNYLEVSRLKLNALDVTKNINLLALNCNLNQIASLDVSKNIKLNSLNCSNNQLKFLDVSKNIDLSVLSGSNNQLTSLDISTNLNLYNLSVYSNQLTTLDVSKNIKLTNVICNVNKLTSLDLSKNTKLSNFGCATNQLKSLNLKNGNNSTIKGYSIILTENPELSCITVDDVAYANKNWTDQKDREAYFSSYDCATITQISDPAFEDKLIAMGIDTDSKNGLVLNSSIAAITSLDISNSSIINLEGIQGFKALTTLIASGNLLKKVDLSKNSALTTLNTLNNPTLSCIQVADVAVADTWNTTKDATTNFNLDCNLYTLIPDSKFEDKLIALNIDKDGKNGKVKTESIEFITSLDVSTDDITDLTGIQDFKNLKKLSCKGTGSFNVSNGKLTKLDVSKNLMLTELNCSYNQLTNLDVSKNLSLGVLYLNNNKLTEINFSANKNLTTLNCNNNPITKINTSENPALAYLYCTDVSVTSLNVTNNLALKALDFERNAITDIDVSKNTALEFLNCAQNPISSLNLTNNKNLQNLNCSGSYYQTNGGSGKITTLNLYNNPLLTSLDCSSNQLSKLDLSSNPKITIFRCYGNILTDLDLSKNTALTQVSANSNRLKSINFKNGNNTKATTVEFKSNPGLDCIQVDDVSYANSNWNTKKDETSNFSTDCAYSTLIPDPKFEDKLIALGIDSGEKDGKVLTKNIVDLTSLDVSNAQITDLTGIESFINLESLAADSNNLTKINVSENQKLANLNVSKNQLTRLNVTNNLRLVTVYCSDNLLTNLDLSKNLSLITTYCPNNKLISLNLKNGNNTASDISGIKNFTNNPDLRCIQVDNETNANAKWASYKDSSANYSSNCEYSTAIPDPKFEDKLIALGIDSGEKDGKVATANINAIVKINLDNSEIKNLTGIQDFISLKNLSLRNNQLSTLDISKNTELTNLDISVNQLASIDISKNTNLTNLDSSLNRLTNIDVSKNIKLGSLIITNNEFTDLNISKNTNLTSLNINYNKIPTIDVSKNSVLASLYAVSNKMESLNISNNKYLTVLDIASNQISSLDVSQNPLLQVIKVSQNILKTFDVSQNPALNFLTVNNNQLTNLNLKNGKNTFLTNGYISLYTNPKLYCILVDNVTYANTNWLNRKDDFATFNTECTGEITLPANNFTVETKGESCLGENNGEISIAAKNSFAYTATINDKTYTFNNNNLKVTSLTPGVYKITITIPEMIFEQNFTVTIAKGATITGKSSVTSKTVDVEITSGTAPFTVFVDGTEQFQTNDASFSLDVIKNALVEVATAKACEGVFAKKVAVSDFDSDYQILSAYPNPTRGSFEIEIPSAKNEVKIELYNFSGQLISAKTYPIENGKAQLNLENQPSGIYAAKIYLDTPEYIKIIKK
ncbi:hypothetical protein FLA105534_02119 [Flavobacterium bizetiae]|uniref:Secretion system C-terminal sorting domain-containing protein n=1 Tax=Flavobacterium bizetiae TaxID=2704140 RepID=A0A6J4GJM8_9FLAO|nr:T9SS type A sorting domain-containing protein [Flavobacterium bizetiae]CAA9198462.1 hypothetical protein FLA105534_02119 [Flavobacterium bizetiae]CAD5349113.1 hypothetical protein FLA105534_03095 [Flavobacterium bizetiae]